ncbi:hypothetical protein NEMBOFW57_004286 [Staphylotrichum longicolle]|uniref:Uncharacterized protein n=1 Tax=Staphylotrichum longicolle TaxID=669026 RepID=A0AAD4F746_9PEZI|nr:hypothetical protein NEMBOFW57_004286 [Staphylotrichum longicolle]
MGMDCLAHFTYKPSELELKRISLPLPRLNIDDDLKSKPISNASDAATNKDFEVPQFEDVDAVERSELQNLVRDGRDIALPWHRNKTIRLGTCLHSSRLHTDNPWADEMQSPFLLAHLYQVPAVLRREFGTTATYKSVETSLQCNTRDHLSVGFGVGVGLPFLASVSVKGHYDSDVMKNTDSNKTSIRASLRTGSVELARAPRLTDQAIAMIRYNGGIEALESRYGDYYVAGYRLGGDTALLLSSSAHATKERKVYGVTVTTEVLFFEASKHWEKAFDTFASGSTLTLLGYDTLAGKNWNERAEGGGEGAARLFDSSKEIGLSTQCLGERLSDILDGMGLQDGAELDAQTCDELIRKGVVVELVLRPVRTLRQAIQWMLQDNII